MDALVFHLAAGITAGAIYAMVALGYTLVYGIIKLINFAHGEFYMVGAYAGFGLFTMPSWLGDLGQRAHVLPAGHHWGALLPDWVGPWGAMAVIVLAAGGAGALVAVLAERVAYRPIRRSGRLVALVTAIGVSFLLQNLALFIDNGNPLSYTRSGSLDRLCQSSIAVGTGGIRAIEFLYVPMSLLMMAAFWHVVRSTRFGMAMRAVSLDLDAARLMGIDVNGVIRNTFLAAGFFAGVAGALVSLRVGMSPQMGFLPGLNAFVAAVVGGIGSIPGALVGGYILGIVQYLVVWAGVPTGYKDVASFILLILVLVVRPEGILGRRTVEKV